MNLLHTQIKAKLRYKHSNVDNSTCYAAIKEGKLRSFVLLNARSIDTCFNHKQFAIGDSCAYVIYYCFI